MPKWPEKAPLGSTPRLTDYPPRFHEGPSVRERKERKAKRQSRRVARQVASILNESRSDIAALRRLGRIKVD